DCCVGGRAEPNVAQDQFCIVLLDCVVEGASVSNHDVGLVRSESFDSRCIIIGDHTFNVDAKVVGEIRGQRVKRFGEVFTFGGRNQGQGDGFGPVATGGVGFCTGIAGTARQQENGDGKHADGGQRG